MPKRATPENTSGTNEPDWGEAWEIIEEIHASEQEQSTISGSIGKKWQRVEKMGVNRVGAQLASRVFKMEAPIQADVLRTMYELFRIKGIAIPEDLVDMAEKARGASETGGGSGGRRPSFLPDATDEPPPPATPAAAPDHPADDSDLAGETTRVNLKTGMIEVLADGGDPADDKAWSDKRDAEPAELAAERERLQADFDAPGGEKEWDPGAEAAAAAKKAPRKPSPKQSRTARKAADAKLRAASGAGSEAVH